MNIIVMDTETTGLLRPGKDILPGITQLGAIKLDQDLVEIDSYEQDINPELSPDDWEQGAIKLRGIGPGDLNHAPTFFAAFFGFAEFVRGAKVWCGYNINGFDTKVVSNQLERYGFSHHFPWPIHHIDVMPMVTKHFGKRRKLGDAYQDIFGRKFDNAHEAMADIRATADLLRELGAEDVKNLLRKSS